MRFFLAVIPTAKGRPRLGKGRTRTPEKTSTAESAVALLASPHAPREPYSGAVRVGLEFVMPLPKSYSRELHGTPHIKKPDLDNLVKLVLDALGKTGSWWRDDSQVSSFGPSTSKRYQRAGEEHGIWVEIAGIAEVKD